jgi:myo-inositol-1(or 4)-monophosphatase
MSASAPALSSLDLDRREAACRRLLVSAGRIAMDGYAKMAAGAEASLKGPQDFLTETDGRVEEHIRSELAHAFPEDGFLGEEGGGSAAARIWVVDPIDGTANFMRGLPHFCVSMAFLDQDRVEIGGIANPATGETYFARRGRGATRNGEPIHVAKTRSFERATVELGWSPRIPNRTYIEAVSALLALGANIRRAGSGALALAFVADGRQDAYVELHMNAWDCLAGLLLVREAGGRVNRFLEGDSLMKGNAVLAAAPGIAEAVSRAAAIALEPEEGAMGSLDAIA